MKSVSVDKIKPLFYTMAAVGAASALTQIWIGYTKQKTPQWGFYVLLTVGILNIMSSVLRLGKARAKGSLATVSVVASLIFGIFCVYVGIKGRNTPTKMFNILLFLGVLYMISTVIAVAMFSYLLHK